ncbi:MAG: SAM-dependent chlorinase/fluorinase [Proteobacteria bacterium]|nr:SAM-dependent chlorinase/fluorinase [Pseudomonadota bacterium]
MIVLFTDFGLEGPYVGQIKAVLHREAPGAPVIDLFHDAPAHEPELAAYLLAAYVGEFPEGAVFLCVVDPGVGSEERRPAVVRAEGRWYVGPDNGLFAIVARRARAPSWWDITARPGRLSATFHGRDLFAPVAARLARGEQPPGERRDEASRPGSDRPGSDWPDDLPRIIYFDRFGNAMTGLRAAALTRGQTLEVNGRPLARARTFSDAPPGQPFWYENSSGLAAIAVNRGRADEALGLHLGDPVIVRDG